MGRGTGEVQGMSDAGRGPEQGARPARRAGARAARGERRQPRGRGGRGEGAWPGSTSTTATRTRRCPTTGSSRPGRSDATSPSCRTTERPEVVLGSPYVRASSTMEHALDRLGAVPAAGARRAAARARPGPVRRDDRSGDQGHLPRGGRAPRGHGQVLLPPAGRGELDRRRAPGAQRAHRRPQPSGRASGCGCSPTRR